MRLRVGTVGDSGVGKTHFVKRFCERRAVPRSHLTIGVDVLCLRLAVENQDVLYTIFDFSGDPLFFPLREEIYPILDGLFLVFDLSDPTTFEHLGRWMSEIHLVCSSTMPPSPPPLITLIGNKADSTSSARLNPVHCQTWARQQGWEFYEASAATGVGVTDAFQRSMSKLARRKAASNPSPTMTPQAPAGRAQNPTREYQEAYDMIMKGKTAHEKLGVSKYASKEEVNRAYRKLAVLLHPDKSRSNDTEEAFKVLATARANLLGK